MVEKPGSMGRIATRFVSDQAALLSPLPNGSLLRSIGSKANPSIRTVRRREISVVRIYPREDSERKVHTQGRLHLLAIPESGAVLASDNQ